MGIKIYNTLTRKIEDFVTPEEEVKMYVCGLTPYDDTHIGHARCYMAFDAIRRYLESRGYKVNHIQNFTDIDDKIIKRAKEVGLPPDELSEKYIESYHRDMDKLGILRAHEYPRVTKLIPDIVDFIKVIVDKGFAYEADGSVYFKVDAFPDYGKLSGRVTEEMRAGARVEILEEKRNPMDFALWKKSEENEPGWESPWGRGRPGWHIECSAMSIKYLGHGFTLHGGARDLIFPHHENEIAQSEAYAGKAPFVRYWAHVGFVTVNGEKMAKSLGNFITLRDVLEKFHPETVRLYLLSTHYRSPIDFSYEDMNKSVEGLKRLYLLRARLKQMGISSQQTDSSQAKDKEQIKKQIIQTALKSYLDSKGEVHILLSPIKECETRFHAAMEDDFNTAQAIAEIFNIASLFFKYLDEEGDITRLASCYEIFSRLCRSLGLLASEKQIDEKELLPKLQDLWKEYSKDILFEEEKSNVITLSGSFLKNVTLLGITIWEPSSSAKSHIHSLIQLRLIFRKQKNFKASDEIRNKLKELNIILEDTKDGTTWRYDEFGVW